jgi:hypothetical protein
MSGVLENEIVKALEPLEKKVGLLETKVDGLEADVKTLSKSSSSAPPSSSTSPSMPIGSAPEKITLEVNTAQIRLDIKKIPVILKNIKRDTYNLMQQTDEIAINKAKRTLLDTLTKSSQPIAFFITDLFNSTKKKTLVGFFRSTFKDRNLVRDLPKLHSDLNELLPKFGLKVVEGRVRTMLVLQQQFTSNEIKVKDDILTLPAEINDEFQHDEISGNDTIVGCAQLLVNFGKHETTFLSQKENVEAYGKYLLYLTSAVSKIASKYNLESGTDVYRYGGRKTKKQRKNAHKKTHYKRRL